MALWCSAPLGPLGWCRSPKSHSVWARQHSPVMVLPLSLTAGCNPKYLSLPPPPPPTLFFSRLYLWKEARERVMIFKKHPLPKKGYSLHTQRFAPQTGRLGCQAASHPGSAEQGFLPRFPSSLLPGAVTQISTLLSARFLEHRAHLELLKPKYPPPHLPHPEVRFFQS